VVSTCHYNIRTESSRDIGYAFIIGCDDHLFGCASGCAFIDVLDDRFPAKYGERFTRKTH
jgi:hypothetical protein